MCVNSHHSWQQLAIGSNRRQFIVLLGFVLQRLLFQQLLMAGLWIEAPLAVESLV
jgi:hypothetical protein